MEYNDYLATYSMPSCAIAITEWLHHEHRHGRVYLHEGNFYSTETGHLVGRSYEKSEMRVNEDKLASYLEEEMIMQFDSLLECMDFFNTYDSQDFKTIQELQEYQGWYGFRYNGKWYHISFNEALDVLDAPKR